MMFPTSALPLRLRGPRWLATAVLAISAAAGTPAMAQEEYLDVLISVDPSDNMAAVPTAELARRLSAAIGKTARVTMASGLKDAMRASRTSENKVLIAPAHVAASGTSHGYKLVAMGNTTRTFALVTQPDITDAQQLKAKRLYLPQQDSLRSYVARGVLDQARLSLKDFAKVDFQNTSGAGLIALSLKRTDATIAETGEAQSWLKDNPGKARVLLTSREVPGGLAILTHKSMAADLQAKIARWATSADAALPGQPPFVASTADGEQKLTYLASLGIHTPDALGGVSRVSADDVAKLMQAADKPVLVDTRSAQEFNNETIPGAVSAPYGEKSLKERDYDAKLDELSAIRKLDKARPTVFFCNGPECWKSYKAADQALKMGFSKVYWLRGGVPEWRATGHALRKHG